MKKADLKPGMIVAIRTHHSYCRPAIVVATDGYAEMGAPYWSLNNKVIPVDTSRRRTPKVAVAAEQRWGVWDEEARRTVVAWVPELVLPQQISCTWKEYEIRQAEIKRAVEERGRRVRQAMEVRNAQLAELKKLIEELGYSGSIRSNSFHYGELRMPYAVAIEIFTELVKAQERIDADA